ncbi:type II secretion system F family protein [Nocardioides dongxiaopingii]|uniref:type II secretion system F family protein n=1 Tax=Nocardioides dongxiaopingii TaxID=2576036 RepID=UPI0010C76AA1|nr:type II secretion system F family protein [Nocardioides dongxiaopingii]
MSRFRPRRTIAVVAGLLALSGPATAAVADDDPVGLVEQTASGLQIVIDVPEDIEPETDAVEVTLDDIGYPVEARRLEERFPIVDRTVILAIDTSRSMASNQKFVKAKAAAVEFLRVVPDDVAVGVVTFDDDVVPVLPPTTDHVLATAAVEGLDGLQRDTWLYDAVLDSVDLAGDDGFRSVLVLSDGRNVSPSSPTDLDDVLSGVEESEVTVDVVALDLGDDPEAVGILERIATAGGGAVVDASAGSLRRLFADEAARYERQFLIDVDIPEDVLTLSATGQITVPTNGATIVADYSFFPRGTDDAAPAPAPPPGRGTGLPPWALYLAIALVGVAVLVGFVGMAPTPAPASSVEARIAGYTAGGGHRADKNQPDVPVLTQATEAIDGVLQHNRGFEERVAARLTSAGSALKASEWLLLHAGLVVGAILLGLLLGRANPAVVVLFALLGLVLPWFWLGLRRGRRRQKFESALPETLQLMAGSLSAGLSMLQAVDTIVREGTDPVASEFRRVLVEIRLGVPLDDALEGVAERFNSSDFRWVVMAIRIQRQVGGNLAELLTTVAGTIREREFIRRQVDALAAEGKLSAVVLGGLPPAFLLYLVVAQPSYVEPLFTDLRGLIMLVFSAVWLGIGIVWMSRLVKVEV